LTRYSPDWAKRLSENLPNLPLEGWISLLSQSPQVLSPDTYQTWKSWVTKTYPLCPAWEKLP
jgi:hypothetical protein